MTIISADYLLLCDEAFTILENQAVVFDQKIIEIGAFEILESKYPDANIVHLPVNSVVMPGLVNVHVHLEFSANKTTLSYGDFMTWLKSVIAHRDELSLSCDTSCIDAAIEGMLSSGTTTIGAISSYGSDMTSCIKAAMRVVYFNEVLGSSPHTVDAMYANFKDRLAESKAEANPRFIPAISVHSPYSTHPILAKKALEIAKDEGMVVSTHFMESEAEREWLDRGDGHFVGFFASFAPNAKPVNDAKSYLSLFEGQKVLFTHATKADEKEVEMMNDMGSITHCPVSNRLLGNGRLHIDIVKHLTLGTDGLSSNNSLSLWDEMRAAVMMHYDLPLQELAQTLLLAATSNGAKALDVHAGELSVGKSADIITLTLADKPQDLSAIALWLILHTRYADNVYIEGEKI